MPVCFISVKLMYLIELCNDQLVKCDVFDPPCTCNIRVFFHTDSGYHIIKVKDEVRNVMKARGTPSNFCPKMKFLCVY